MSAPKRLLQVLREYWRWWAIPMAITLLLVVVLAYLQSGDRAVPAFKY